MLWNGNHLKLDFVACLHTCKNIMPITGVEYDLTSTLKPLFFPLVFSLTPNSPGKTLGAYIYWREGMVRNGLSKDIYKLVKQTAFSLSFSSGYRNEAVVYGYFSTVTWNIKKCLFNGCNQMHSCSKWQLQDQARNWIYNPVKLCPHRKSDK